MARPFASTPYAGPGYEEGPSRITDLILRAGDARARAAEQQGQIWGSTVAGLGQMAGQMVSEHQERKGIAKRDAALIDLMGRPDATPQDFARVAGPQLGIETYAAVQAFNKTKAGVSREEAAKLLPIQLKVFQKLTPEARQVLYPAIRENSVKMGLLGEADAPPEYTPDLDPTIKAFSDALSGDKQEGFTLGRGEVRFGPGGEKIAEGLAPEEKPDTRSLDARYAEAVATGDQATAQQLLQAKARLEAAGRAPEGAGSRIWVMRDGKPVRVAESQIQPGDIPYESARTGQKKMPAGSAEDLAQFQTSLDEAERLTTALSGTAGTGVTSRAGALLPNVVTELTGIGAEAKTRQAVIDRVKQVIGKALEGGVLRKEDELKYTKILPTIGDAPDVAANKLAGLKEAIAQKRQRTIEALSDAGYDTSAFEARAAKAKPSLEDLGKKYGF